MEEKEMTTAITFYSESNIHESTDISRYDRSEPAVWNRYHLLAFVGFTGGSLTALLGLSLSVIAWFEPADIHPSLSTLGTMFVVATIPLLILGAQALDRIDSIADVRDQFEREKRCKKQGRN